MSICLYRFLESKGLYLSLHKLLAEEVKKVSNSTGEVEWGDFLKMMVGPQNILQRACNNDLAIPDWEAFVTKVTCIYNEVHRNNSGAPADYIPELGCADPNWFGVTICTVDGQVWSHGDADLDFSIQSCGKPLLYSMTVEDFGYDYVHKFVGKEPSGREFNGMYTKKRFGKLAGEPFLNISFLCRSFHIKLRKQASQQLHQRGSHCC
jgi:hypothetical protein